MQYNIINKKETNKQSIKDQSRLCKIQNEEHKSGILKEKEQEKKEHRMA